MYNNQQEAYQQQQQPQNLQQQYQQQQQQFQNEQNRLQQYQNEQIQQDQFIPNQHLNQGNIGQPQNNLYQNNSEYYGKQYGTGDIQGNYSMMSEGGRRRYPKTMQDQKTEWYGVQQHKKEVDNEIQKNENDIRNLKMKHLLTELDKKLLQEYEAKRDKLLIKRMEAEEMMKQMEIYQEKLRQNRQDKVSIQNHLSGYYDNQRNEQAARDYDYKAQKLDWENRLIEYNRERLKSEEERNRYQKDYLNQEKMSDLQRNNLRKEQDRQDFMRNREEHNKLIDINSKKQLIKEENYRQFYRNVAENQEQQYLIHYDSVMKPMLEKIAELEAIINRNVNELQRRRAQDELTKLLKKKNEMMRMHDDNLQQMREHQDQKDSYKIERQMKVKDRLQDLANYNEYLEFKKMEKKEGQQKLKNFLDAQQDEKQNQYLNQERMTKNEKGLNKLDLQAFKEREGGLYSMIPGWSPQVGQLPPRQNREELARQIMDTMKPQNKRTMSELNNVQATFTAQNMYNNDQQLNRQSSTRLANLGQSALGNQNTVQDMQSSTYLKEYQRIGEPMSHYQSSVINTQDTLGKEYRQRDVYRYNHNPITNPMPYNIQNPYIQQQYLNINQNSNKQVTVPNYR